MKKLFSIFVIVLICTFTANANLLTENFSYTTGQLDAVSGGANVSGGNWVNFSGTTNVINVVAGSLSYSGYTPSGVDNKISIINGSAEDAYTQFTTQTSGTTVYASFLMNITSTTGMAANSSTTGDYSIAFLPSSSVTALNARVSVRTGSVAGTYNYGLRGASSNAAATFAPTDYSPGTTHLIVISYTIGTDVVNMWIDPSIPEAEPAADLTQTAGTALADIARFAVRQGTNSVIADIDGITVGTSWSDIGLPVELTSFSAIVKGKSVELVWKTATEVNNHGFEVEKNVNSAWSKIGFVAGAGNSNSPKSYSYVDASASGKVSYRLKQVDNDGKFVYSNVVEAIVTSAPAEFGLSQNYPNPFNPTTNISYALPTTSHVTLRVYDIIGNEVVTLVNGTQEAGEQHVQFNASKLSSGLYFYTITAGNFTATKKLLLMK